MIMDRFLSPGLASTFKRVWGDKLGRLGLILVALIITSALGADILSPYSPIKIDLSVRLQAPSLAHPLGTDQLGRDVLSRILFGGRVALMVAGISLSLAIGIGTILGMSAGYGPPWLDNVIIAIFDTIRSYPMIIFAMAVVTLTGPSLPMLILIIATITLPDFGRIVRTQTLALRNSEFILVERAMGASHSRILFVHILPNVVGPLLVLGSMDVAGVVGIEAALSFLGLGVRPPQPSWGNLLNDGFAFIRDSPWLITCGSIPLILTTLGFTFLGESLRDALDPKLRKNL